MKTRPPDTPWLTKQEAADRGRVSLKDIDRAIASGELTARRAGRRVIIHRDWLDAWIDSLQAAAS
jgi:excisionase family DNA binding protein